MAKRRCIALDIYNKDTFIDMSDKAKMLYTYLMLNTDDYGFIINPKTVLRTCKASDKELQELVCSGFLIDFGSGIYVITHWKAQNSIQPSRIQETIYQSERKQLRTNERNEYELITECQQKADNLSEDCQPNITEDNITEDNSTKPKKTKNKKMQVNKTAFDKASDDAAYLQEFDTIRINKGVKI